MGENDGTDYQSDAVLKHHHHRKSAVAGGKISASISISNL